MTGAAGAAVRDRWLELAGEVARGVVCPLGATLAADQLSSAAMTASACEDDRPPSTRGTGRVATSGTASGRAPTGNSRSVTTSPTAAAAPAAVSCRRSSAVALESYRQPLRETRLFDCGDRRRRQFVAVGENQIGGEQLLAASRVVAGTPIHLLEILQGAGGGVDRRLGRSCRRLAAQSVQRLTNGRNAAVHLRGPELIALTGGDVTLLRAAECQNVPLRRDSRRIVCGECARVLPCK